MQISLRRNLDKMTRTGKNQPLGKTEKRIGTMQRGDSFSPLIPKLNVENG